MEKEYQKIVDTCMPQGLSVGRYLLWVSRPTLILLLEP